MHNRLLLASALALPLAACSKQAPDPRGIDRDEVLLTVTATGRSETRPDQALFTVGLSTIEATSRSATEKNNEKMTKVVDALKGLSVGDKDLKTQSVNVSRLDYGPNKGKYQASNMVEVRVRDVAKVSAAIAAATDAGANIVSGPNLSNADPEKVALSSYGAAYKAAYAKAEAYAKAANMHISRVLTIQDGAGGGGVPRPYDAARMASVAPAPVMAEQAAAPPFMPGMNQSYAFVRVDFALEPNG
ncbi:MAG: SIMPL domain-containing protein [Sphingobium sp.]